MPTVDRTRARRPYLPERKPHQGRTVDNSAFYNSPAWRKYSALFRQANPLCVNFPTCRGSAQVVDHITPMAQGGDAWDELNHQQMCKRCHDVKSAGEGRARRVRPGGIKNP
jgi:5-methylcytosine-specific restriction protein A